MILYLILVFSGLEVQSSQGKVYGSIGGTSNIKDDYDIKIAESIRNKNCAILYKTKTRIAFITLKAAFDGADERREDGKRFLANLLQKPVPLTTLGAPQPKPVAYCNADTCANRGVCLDQWTSPACDCDLTSFTGPTCTDGRPMLPRLRDFKAECSD